LNLKDVRLISLAVAGRAGGVRARQEHQLDLDAARAIALRAATLCRVIGEVGDRHASLLRLWGISKEPTDVIEKARISRDSGTHRAPDRFLGDVHQPADLFDPRGALHAEIVVGVGVSRDRSIRVLVRDLVGADYLRGR